MAKPIEPITPEQLAQADMAVESLRRAVEQLKACRAPKALERARLALSSAEGAQRHAWHRYHRMETTNAVL